MNNQNINNYIKRFIFKLEKLLLVKKIDCFNKAKVQEKEAKVSATVGNKHFQEEEDFKNSHQDVLLQHQFNIQGLNEDIQPKNNKTNFYSLHEKKPEVNKSLLKSRIFYISIHILTFILIIFYDNQIKDQLIEGESLQPYFYVVLVLLSSYFFWICGNNPGYAPYETDIEMQSPFNREISSTGIQNNDDTVGKNNQDDISDNQSNQSQYSSSKYNIPIPQNSLAYGNNLEQYMNNEDEIKQNLNNNNQEFINKSENFKYITSPKAEKRQIYDVQQSIKSEQLPYPIEESIRNNNDPQISNQDEERYLRNNKNNESGSINSSDSSEDFNDDFPPEDQRSSNNTNEDSEQLDASAQLFHCHICQRHQPFRSKHCFDCGRCICKFDHHWQDIQNFF